MKHFLILMASLIVTSTSFGKDIKFICNTKTEERYYVKTTIEVVVKNEKSVFLNTYDLTAESWNKGSEGAFSKKNPKGLSVFKDFDSEDLFGDLSEGAADKGIYLYVSQNVMSGKNGTVSLFARGTEVGLENATYTCTKQK